MNQSPKGNYRLKWFAIIGFIFMLLVAFSGGFDNYGVFYLDRMFNPSGWVFKQFNNIAEMCIGLFVLYIAHRSINHKRTHEFMDDKKQSLVITGVWILAIAYVIGNALR